MAATVAVHPMASKKVTLESVFLRLSDLHGDSAASWANRLNGAASCYRRVAEMNRVLCEMGFGAKVAELMEPIDDTLETSVCDDPQHEEAMTDATEDVLQEQHRANPTATTARALIRCRAQMRRAALADDRRLAKQYGILL